MLDAHGGWDRGAGAAVICLCGHTPSEHYQTSGRCEAASLTTRLANCDCLLFTEHRKTVVVQEKVDHPSHYGGADNPYEVIKVLRAWYPDGVFHFCVCNAIKYIARAGKKGSTVEDLKKARWYLDYLIVMLEPKQET